MDIQKPITFISKEFLIKFVKLLNYRLSEFTALEKAIINYLELLIFYNSIVYINLKNEEILEIVKKEIDNNSSDDEKLFLIYFKKILNQGSLIKSCSIEMSNFNQKNKIDISNHKVKPTYLLLNVNISFIEDLNRINGIITVSNEIFKLKRGIYEVILINSKSKTEIFNLESVFEHLPFCNSVIIEDPYLLRQPINYIKKLISCLMNKSLDYSNSTVTIITNLDYTNNALIESLKISFDGICKIEHYSTTNIHDRNIYTNSFWISSDYGFMEKYSKTQTKWNCFPISTYYEMYFHKLKLIASNLKKEKIKTVNELIKDM